MNIEEILAEVRKGRIAIDGSGDTFTWDEMKDRTFSALENMGPWSLAPITKEISLEQLQTAWYNCVDHFRQPNFEEFKKELGF